MFDLASLNSTFARVPPKKISFPKNSFKSIFRSNKTFSNDVNRRSFLVGRSHPQRVFITFDGANVVQNFFAGQPAIDAAGITNSCPDKTLRQLYLTPHAPDSSSTDFLASEKSDNFSRQRVQIKITKLSELLFIIFDFRALDQSWSDQRTAFPIFRRQFVVHQLPFFVGYFRRKRVWCGNFFDGFFQPLRFFLTKNKEQQTNILKLKIKQTFS